VNCAKTAELTEIPFGGRQTRVGMGLDGGVPDSGKITD